MARAKKTPAERTPSTDFQKDLAEEWGGLPVPQMTPQLAMVYAGLLRAGCPALRAVFYVVPTLNETEKGQQVAKRVAWRWNHDAEVIAALESSLGGKWHELEVETRLRLAKEKSDSEAAFFLYANNFNDIEHREGLEKIKLARDIVKGALGQRPDDDDPMAAFARFAMDMARAAHDQKASRGKTAPQLTTGDGLDKLLNTLPTRPS